jgi:predicted short-subunit dehydrogenase-like oxidoreductase (DUF2520 family)
MSMNPINQLRVSIIGSGKVAHSFCKAMQIGEVEIVQIYNRNRIGAEKLASKLDRATVVDRIEDLNSNVDAVAVLVKDDAIESTAKLIPFGIKRFHASGVTDREVLGGENGVVWPIKSFNSETASDSLVGVPFGVDASSEEFKKTLDRLVTCLGGRGFYAPSEVRAKVHLAAVFSDNFANHCLAISQQILHDSGISPDLLQTLAEGVLSGALTGSSFKRQTGVAIRGDKGSQQKHLELIKSFSNSQELAELYILLSKHIYESHKNYMQ